MLWPTPFKITWGAREWLNQLSVRLLITAQVVISGSWNQTPRRAPCSAGNMLQDSLSPSLSLSASPLLTLSLSLSPSLR